MRAWYGANAVSYRVVYEWVEILKNGHMSVTDAEHSGHRTTATTTQNDEPGNRFFKTEE
jgi:hypothetical protein